MIKLPFVTTSPNKRSFSRTKFVQLDDVPGSYTGMAGQSVTVKATEDGLQFSAGGGVPALTATQIAFGSATNFMTSAADLVTTGVGTASRFITFGLQTGGIASYVITVKTQLATGQVGVSLFNDGNKGLILAMPSSNYPTTSIDVDGATIGNYAILWGNGTVSGVIIDCHGNTNSAIILSTRSTTGNTVHSTTRMRVESISGIVSVNTLLADIKPSAIFQVKSTTQGFLKPRMTTTQRSAITAPEEGLEVYDNTLHTTYYWNGTAWVTYGGGAAPFVGDMNAVVVTDAAGHLATHPKMVDLTTTGFNYLYLWDTSNKFELDSYGGTCTLAIHNEGTLGQSGFSIDCEGVANTDTTMNVLTTLIHTIDGNEIYRTRDYGLSLKEPSPVACAILQAKSTTQGFLFPRMTTTQKNAIGSPVEGLVVYDLTLHVLSTYNGTTWI